MSRVLSQPPYGNAYAGRGWLVERQIEEKKADGTWGPKDISAARYTYRIRAFDEQVTPKVRVFEHLLTKKAGSETEGWLRHYCPHGLLPKGVLRWELIEVDNDGSDGSTPTTKPEVVLEEWHQDVKAKPPTP